VESWTALVSDLTGRPPMLVVLSGPSGAGKDSVIQLLRGAVPDMWFAVSATTRRPRRGESPGYSYFFICQSEFDEWNDRGELLAPANVHGNWYGVPLTQVREAFDRGQDVFLKIDVQGGTQIRRRLPQAVFIFLAPPSLDDLIERLQARHTESPDELDRRIADARTEMAQLPLYDYVVVNREGCLHDAVAGVTCIISAERLRTHRQPINLETVDS
jgi:guanylate kinase